VDASERANIARKVAQRARDVRDEQTAHRLAVVRSVAAIGRATTQERGERLLSELHAALRQHEAWGVPPPLLTLAKRSSDEKPYNRFLGWLLDPARDHQAAIPALRAIARLLRFEALAHDIEAAASDRTEKGCRIEVRSELRWPDGADSRQEPDLLICGPRSLLLIENKVRSGESGDQFGPYFTALQKLANASNVPREDARAHLLAPDRRETPEGWGPTITHAELAGELMALAGSKDLPFWSRVLCFFVADAFEHDRSLAHRLERARNLTSRLAVDSIRPADLLEMTELLPLPNPFNEKEPP
jgi:hypothetical protein